MSIILHKNENPTWLFLEKKQRCEKFWEEE